jgi:hypothetical protein
LKKEVRGKNRFKFITGRLITNETHIPAKKPKDEAGAWFYEEDAHQERAGCNQAPPGKRA